MHFYCRKTSLFLTTYPPLNANLISDSSFTERIPHEFFSSSNKFQKVPSNTVSFTQQISLNVYCYLWINAFFISLNKHLFCRLWMHKCLKNQLKWLFLCTYLHTWLCWLPVGATCFLTLSGPFWVRQAQREVVKIKKSWFFLLGIKYTLRTCFESKNFLPNYCPELSNQVLSFSEGQIY